MSFIPTGVARVPNLLLSQATLRNATRTNIDLARLQEQLASGKALSRPSDDAVRAATVSLLNERLERAEQVSRNLDHADSALNEADQALSEASNLLLEARQIASAQASLTASPEERKGQATVINTIIQGMFGVGNRESVAGHVFGGVTPGRQPIEELLGGFRYDAGSRGLITDLGVGVPVPITLGGTTALGSTSARVRGTVDLDPALTPQTRLADLDGARGLGVTLGSLEFSYDGSERVEIDLRGADTIGDVTDRIESALSAFAGGMGDALAGPLLGPAGVTIEDGSIRIDLMPDAEGGVPPALVFSEIGAGTTARDLGLASDDGTRAFSAVEPMGADLSPHLTWTTPIEALNGLGTTTDPLGSIRIRAAGRSVIVDLSQAETVQDLRNAIEGTGLGLRVQIEEPGGRLAVRYELAGGKQEALSIEEVQDNGSTASRLGLRTLDLGTRLSDFNDGRGVEIVTGGTDPVSGLPDPARDRDFTITLGDGTEIDIDLQPEDIVTVGTLLEAINTQAGAQLADAGLDPGVFQARLLDGANGISLSQDAGDPTMTGAITVQARNNSLSAFQLGLMDGRYDATSATLIGEDRATVRVDNVFTHLIDLRDALENDDTTGITLAGASLERMLDSVGETRATVGGLARRVQAETRHTEDRVLLDTTTKSRLEDVDFVQAVSELSLLQTQLQAGYQSAATLGNLSLLDFLG